MKTLVLLVCLAVAGYVLADPPGCPLVQVNVNVPPNCACGDGEGDYSACACNNDSGETTCGCTATSTPDNGGNTDDTTGNDGNTGDTTGNGSDNPGNGGDTTGNGNDNPGNSQCGCGISQSPWWNTTGTSPAPSSGAQISVGGEYCYIDVENTCAANQNQLFCKSSYGDFSTAAQYFSQLVRNIMKHNYEYLTLYINYANYLRYRPGFASMFKQLSDYHWDLAKYTIDFITEKGGVMDFNPPERHCSCSDESSDSSASTSEHSLMTDLPEGPVESTGSDPAGGEYAGKADGYEMFELEALAWTADIVKQVCIAADNIHLYALDAQSHDVQSAQYIMRSYVRPFRKILGNVVRYVNTLAQMLSCEDQMVALYKFDDILYEFDVQY